MSGLVDEIKTNVYLHGTTVILFLSLASLLLVWLMIRLIYGGEGPRISRERATGAGVMLAVLLLLPIPILLLWRPGVSARQAIGEILYDNHCQVCHGSQGNRMPNVLLGSAQYLEEQGDDLMRQVMREGKGVMPAWGKEREGPLSDDQIEMILEYLKQKAGEGPAPVAPVALAPEPLGEPSADAGRQLYSNNCTMCHGDSGGRLPQADLSSKGFMDTRDDDTLFTAINEGKASMPAFGQAREGPLTETDIWSIVAYLRSLALGP